MKTAVLSRYERKNMSCEFVIQIGIRSFINN